MSSAHTFDEWAMARGVSSEVIDQLKCYAATPQEMKEAEEATEPPPPIFSLQNIQEMTDTDLFGVAPMSQGFIIVGGCPNGDPIAVDLRDDSGSVWYVSHESDANGDLRAISVRVADSLDAMLDRMVSGEDFPMDYFDAVREQP
jgi:hypothetical protein